MRKNKLKHISEVLPTLEELSRSLNVDKTGEEKLLDYDNMIEEIDILKEEKKELEDTLGEYKIELEDLKDDLISFKNWFKELNFNEISQKEITKEFENIFDL